MAPLARGHLAQPSVTDSAKACSAAACHTKLSCRGLSVSLAAWSVAWPRAAGVMVDESDIGRAELPSMLSGKLSTVPSGSSHDQSLPSNLSLLSSALLAATICSILKPLNSGSCARMSHSRRGSVKVNCCGRPLAAAPAEAPAVGGEAATRSLAARTASALPSVTPSVSAANRHRFLLARRAD